MKFNNSAIVGLVCAFASGCAYLPEGHPARTNQIAKEVTKQIEGQNSTGELFVEDDAIVRASQSSEPSGLQIRKSPRGNMESYVVRGQRYHTLDSSEGYSAKGVASWYGPNFHGRTASSGEVYDMYRLTAAHKTLPLPTYAKITHLENGRQVIVKINDRGPFSGDRLIDLSFAAALRLGMVNDGTGMVEIQALSPEEMFELSGSENKLGIDFYYATAEEPEDQSRELSEQVLVENSVALPEGIKVAAAQIDDQPITPQPIESDAVVPGSGRLAIPGTTAANGSASAADGVDVIVDATAQQSAEAPLVPPAGEEVAIDSLAQQTLEAVVPSITDASVQGITTVPAAVQTAKVPVRKDGTGYFIQAGVFADVSDAEKVAIDAVLAAPGEEVNVKPLKDSHMYRVTIGPIVKYDHATKVSGLLNDAGVDNFTVNVK